MVSDIVFCVTAVIGLFVARDVVIRILKTKVDEVRIMEKIESLEAQIESERQRLNRIEFRRAV